MANTVTIAGGANITLSTAANAVTIRAAAAGGAQTAISGLANSQTTYTSGTVSLSELGAITIRSTTGQAFQFSVNSQTVQTQGGFASMGVSTGGNTSGDTTVNTGSRMVYVGSNNITLSQSTAAGASTITISGANTHAQQTGISAISNSNTTYTSGTIGLSELGAITIRSTTGNQFQFSVNSQTVQTEGGFASIGVSTGGNTAGDTGVDTRRRFVLVGSNNITLSQGTGASSATVTVLGANTHAQQTAISGIANSETTYTSGSVTFSTLGAITIRSTTGQQFQFSVNSQTVQTQGGFASMGVSTGGNTAGNTTVNTGSQLVFSGQANITLSQATAAGATTIGISGVSPAGGAFSGGVSNLGNTAGSTGITGTRLVLVGTNGVSLSQSTDANGGTVSFSAGGGGGGFSIASFHNFDPQAASMNLIQNMTNVNLTQRHIFIPFQLAGSLTHNHMRLFVSRATSGSDLFTMQAAIYTMVNSTQLSRLASLQNSFSNTATASNSGNRQLRLTGFEAAGTTLSPGQYVMAVYASAANTASMNYSYRGGQTANNPMGVGIVGPGTDAYTTATSALSSGGYMNFFGLYTATSASPPATVGLTQVQQWNSIHPLMFYLGSTA